MVFVRSTAWSSPHANIPEQGRGLTRSGLVCPHIPAHPHAGVSKTVPDLSIHTCQTCYITTLATLTTPTTLTYIRILLILMNIERCPQRGSDKSFLCGYSLLKGSSLILFVARAGESEVHGRGTVNFFLLYLKI